MSLWNNSFGEKAIAVLEERFCEELPEGFTIESTFLADGIFDDDSRLFSVITSVQKNCGDMADFAVSVFPDGNSLIYCMDDDVFHHTDETSIETALKQGVESWKNNDGYYFKDMITISETVKSIRSQKKERKDGIEI